MPKPSETRITSRCGAQSSKWVGWMDPPSKLVELGAIYQLVTSCQDIQQYLYMVSLLRVVMGCSTWSPTARTLPPGRSTSQSPDDP